MYSKMKEEGAKGIYTYTVTITYQGNKVVQEVYSSSSGQETYKYKYDKERNPFYNLLYGGYRELEINLSKNNITHAYRGLFCRI